jgi:hypothetical protein
VTAVSMTARAMPSFQWPAVPYVLAGAGAYAAPGSGLGRGWTLGAGIRIPVARQSFFFESRIHALHTGARGLERAGLVPADMKYDVWQYMYTPIIFGIQF